jgi:PAS domain S-box-containing protein
MRKFRVKAEHDCPNSPGVPRFRIRLSFAILGVLLCVVGGPIATPQQNPKKVLILFSFLKGGDHQDLNELESELRTAIKQPIDFDVEYLDGRRLDDEEYEQSLVEDLGHTYHEAKLDLVLIQSYAGLRFAAEHRYALFSATPIIFIDVDPDSLKGEKVWPGVTGITVPTGVHGTVTLALHLHPNSKTVAIITANSTPDKYFLSRIHSELLPYTDKVREIDLVGLPTNQLLEKVSALPPQTIVFFQLIPKASVQPAIGAHDILASVAQRLPTYSIFPYDVIGHGGIGGASYDWKSEVSLAASDARRLLTGERLENIPITNFVRPQIVVDWSALRHWHIPESALPPGTLILNRPLTIWQQYRNYILVTIAVIVAQALLIAALLWQRARKRKAEAVLRESEERFRVLADTTPSLVCICDAQGRVTYLNDRWLAFTGQDPQTGFGDSWIAFIHPDDIQSVLNVFWRALKDHKPFSAEYRLHRYDGTYRWMLGVASPRVNGDGSFAGFIGSAVDVTDQKLAQQALEKVSGQLIEAQEKERTRIARDLHDDVCQRLALLSMELEQAKRDVTGRVSATKNLEAMRKHCSEIADDIQSLSHQLHSSKLEYLGIVAAIRGFCREFSSQHGVSVEFTEKDVPTHLPNDVSLCLFRVSQEALRNAVKYSGVNQYKVELSAAPAEVQLQVIDAGTGFDVEKARNNRGLGLVSMQERVHLVRGRFSVESKPGVGTRVLAAVPLPENGQPSGVAEVAEVTSLRNRA